MTDVRKQEIRSQMWGLARGVLTDTANTRASMPSLLDEEYAYAREFLIGIAGATQPGAYRDDRDDSDDAIARACRLLREEAL